LYHVVGHELIHADDIANGNEEKWSKEVNGDNDLLKIIMEHHANMWDAGTEIQFGTDYGAQNRLTNTTETLKEFKLLDLFK
jgi:hypothetical protein